MSASKLNIRFIINLIIVFIVVVVFTFLFEYYLSLVSSKKEPFETRIELAAEKNIFFDRRRRMEVILDIRDNLKFTDRNNYYPIVHPSIFLRRSPLVIEGNEIFPLSSVANVNTVYCNESGEYSIYYSDRFGFNNPPRGEDLKKLDIAVVGDSFANGACVEAGKNAVDNLRKFKPKTLNFGMGGSGPLIEMGIFKEYISQLKPKVLLWFYYEGNDLSDLKKEMREPILTRYHEKKYSQDILNKKRKIDEQLKLYINKNIRINQESRVNKERIFSAANKTNAPLYSILTLERIRGLVSYTYKKYFVNDNDKMIKPFMNILKKVRYDVEKWGGEFYVVILPQWKKYADLEGLTENKTRLTIKKLLKDNNIKRIDFGEFLNKSKDPLKYFPLRYHGHYNVDGYKELSDMIRHRLVKDSVF